MKTIKNMFWALAVLPLMAGVARADDSTVGTKLANLINDIWNPLFLLIAIGAGLGGLYLMAKGLMKLAEAAQERGGKGYTAGFAMIVVGTMLIALPDAAGVGMQSVFGTVRGGGTLNDAGLDYNDNGMTQDVMKAITGGAAPVGAVDNCLTSSTPAVCMAKNIATNAIPMGVMVVFSLVFLSGLVGFGMTLVDMAKNAEGRPDSKGHITRLVMAVMLMNAPVAFSFMTQTVFGTIDSPINTVGLNSSSSLLLYNGGSTLAIVQQYSTMIGYCFTILTFFGVWAYVRGIFMVKGVAEAGRNAGSYGMAGVYMVAGILMANAKASTCIILTTTGGPGLANGFCG